MKNKTIVTRSIGSVLFIGLTLIAPARAVAHCDGIDGPVVKAAQRALDTEPLRSR
jgi:hypothetical protein